MVFKLVESAQQRWRAVNAPHFVALVRAGARFERGHLAERTESHAAGTTPCDPRVMTPAPSARQQAGASDR